MKYNDPTEHAGREVTTGAWLVPASMGDCPDDMWPLENDVVIEL